MRVALIIAAAVLAPHLAAAEILRAETCRKDADERSVEVIAPGDVGAACDVVYRRPDRVAVPYHANVDANYCRARAAELVATLTAEGFSCSASASDDLEAALAGGPSEFASAPQAAPEPENDPLNVQLQKLAQPNDVIAAAQAALAYEEPVQLAADADPIEFQAPRPSRTSGPGRLVGPAPSIDDILDPEAIAATPTSAVAEPIAARSPEEIIRSRIAADVAAWNEGNLDAYMVGYAASADLMIIRNGAVVTGWDAVKQSFADEIAAYGDMGRLSLGALDVKLTAADAATVAGRYTLTRPSSSSSGVVTLVMKQADGKWRIVQETRVADAQ